MLCPNCGRNVNRGDRVCGHCGTRLPYEKMSDLEAAPPLSFLHGEQRGSGTEALQNAVNSQTQRIRELASEVEFLRTWEARSYGKIKRVLCMSIVSLVLCLLLVVISFVLAGSVKQDTSRQLDEKASELSVLIENKIEEIERKLNVLIEKSEQVQLRFTADALKAIAARAIERKTGARGLRNVMERTMLDIMYKLPSMPNVRECLINQAVIEKGKDPVLLYDDGTEVKPEEQAS